MKRTGLAFALLFLAGGLVADPLFCCSLPSDDQRATFAAPPMDCCSEDGTGACAPKLEKAANMPGGSLVPTSPVLTADTPLPVLPQVSPPDSTVSPARAAVERPPRLHLLNSLLRI
jgi:hypothetical protein